MSSLACANDCLACAVISFRHIMCQHIALRASKSITRNALMTTVLCQCMSGPRCTAPKLAFNGPCWAFLWSMLQAWPCCVPGHDLHQDVVQARPAEARGRHAGENPANLTGNTRVPVPALSLLGDMNAGTSYEFYACGCTCPPMTNCSIAVGQAIVGSC